jgi:hypothetical protein
MRPSLHKVVTRRRDNFHFPAISVVVKNSMFSLQSLNPFSFKYIPLEEYFQA